VIPSLRDLLDLLLEIVDESFDLRAPGAQIRSRRLQHRHVVRSLGEHVVDADGFEGGEAHMDVVGLAAVDSLQVGEARGDVHLGKLGAVRLEDGGRRFEGGDALIDLRGASGVSPLEVGEARLPLLVLGIKPAVDLIEHEHEVRMHAAAGTLEASEVRVRQIGIQDRVV